MIHTVFLWYMKNSGLNCQKIGYTKDIMATFKTHFVTTTVISGILAGGLLVTELATVKTGIAYWLLGILGGILPDIDTRQSIPARLLFTGLGMLAASLVVISYLKLITFFELLLIWISIYLTVRYGLFKIFAQFTVHRGNCHSILAALLFGLLTTVIAHDEFKVREFIAWFAGVFIFLGYLTHLILDEVYSVDLLNKKVKKSFGSAFKIASKRHKTSTFLLIVMVLSVFLLTPSTDRVFKVLSHQQTHHKIKTKFSLY